MTVVEELVSVLGLEIGEGALATLSKFRTAVTQGLAGVGGIVAALGAAFAGTVVSVAELGTEINTTALKLGVGTDAIQELKYAADITNVSFESLTTAMKFLSKNAAEGGDAAKRVFEAFSGVAMRDAQGNLKTTDVLLEDFADKIANTKDPIKQVEMAMHALHGQSGVALMPMLKLGKAGIQKLREEAIDLGYVLDKKTIESSARFTVSLKHLKNALLGVRNVVGAPFIDDFSDALDWMTERVRKARAWFQGLTKDIRDLGQRFARIVDVGKRAFDAIRQFITQTRLDKLAESVHWVELLEAALIGVAAVAVVSAASVAASWMLAAAPFILIAVLIGLIVDDIAHFVDGQDSVLGRADKWAKRFDPTDAPEIKFFKTLLALLFDLGDPAKWRRVGDAAIAGFQPFTEWVAKIRNTEPLKTIVDLVTGERTVGQALTKSVNRKFLGPSADKNLFEQPAWPKPVFGSKPEDRAAVERFFRENAFGNKPKDRAVEPGLTGEVRYEDKPPTNFLNPKTGDWEVRPEFKGAFGTQLPPITVNIHGASNPADPEWRKQVQDVIDQALSDARAATTGGS